MQKFKFLILVCLLVFFAGCSGNLFKGLESKGGSTEDKIMDAKLLLENAITPADYANAAIQIKAVMDVLPEGTQKREVQIDYATAKLGEAGVDMVTVATAVTSTTAQAKDDLAKIKDILNEAFNVTNVDSSTNATIASADEFNKAFLDLITGLESTLPKALTDEEKEKINARYKNQMLTAAIANACAAIFTILKEFDNNPRDGNISNIEVTIPIDGNSFATHWGNIQNKVLKHAKNAAKFALKALEGETTDIAKIKDAINGIDLNGDGDRNDLNETPSLEERFNTITAQEIEDNL